MIDLAAAVPPLNERRIAVHVTPDAQRQIRGGHPWLFDQSIVRMKPDSAPAGTLAVVFDSNRNFLAIGLYDPASPIRVRIVHQGDPVQIDGGFWTTRLTAAVQRRNSLVAGGDTTGYRVVNGEGDGFGGLVVDRYGPVVVVKVYSEAWLPHLPPIVDHLAATVGVDAVVLRWGRLAAPAARQATNGALGGDVVLRGTVPPRLTFQECGLTFEVDPVDGQKTGHFLDQRDNRSRVAGFAKGARVLDVFASTGGFSVHAAAGGAAEVTSVDIAVPALRMAQVNMLHNQSVAAVAACRHRVVEGDAFDVLERYAGSGEAFDVVVLDPPSFAHKADQVRGALTSYRRMVRAGLAVLEPGGRLVAASCSSRVDSATFEALVRSTASGVGRPLRGVTVTGHGLDHPTVHPEGRYLKAVFAEV